MQRIPCVLMRGGTSKGPVFLAWDLPAAIQERDELLLNLMGSGHELEIDGIGGGSPQTSKVAIVSPSLHADADVDYLFVQVMVSQRRVDTAPNCGNMLCAVGPFAIEQGLVKASADVTRVRIRNLNTGTFVNAEVQTPGGKVSCNCSATASTLACMRIASPSALRSTRIVMAGFSPTKLARPESAAVTVTVPISPTVS